RRSFGRSDFSTGRALSPGLSRTDAMPQRPATALALKPRAARHLPLAGGPAAPSGHQVNICPRLEQRICRGLNAIHPRDRIENDLLLLPGIVRGDLGQADVAERELSTVLGPADGRVIEGVAALGQLNENAKPDRRLGNPLFDLVEQEVRPAGGRFGVAQIFVAGGRQQPIAPVPADTVAVGELERGYREE